MYLSRFTCCVCSCIEIKDNGILTSIWCDGTGGCGARGPEAAERGAGGNGAAESRDGSRPAPWAACATAAGGNALRLSPRGPAAGLPRRPVWKGPL